ncbi:glucose PTS transporter subunit IIA [Tractidigestivibacter sp.]|uniref:PTS sugar transporter subunit IIA n=1 Tax=Tractidigestivibacter sp. TaxID=2847320 RepID=UPI002A919EB4|nr:glucose PTS transporter subunit IIA [Tractidigestivibacter sp.]MDY5271182.1 glucose PTS transporter subunit IIA [Tractidigestivibacter sp.]
MDVFDFLKKAAEPAKPHAIAVDAQPGMIFAPASGQTVPMAELPDPVFAGGAMGKTLGVSPDEGLVYAPISGTVQVAMPHAFGIANDETEVLIHMGVDTVEMNGDGFEAQVEKGQQVKAGEPLLRFDKCKVAEAGRAGAVTVIVTNTEDLEASDKSVVPLATGSVSAGDPFVSIR